MLKRFLSPIRNRLCRTTLAVFVIASACVLTGGRVSDAAVLQVPQDFSTIQAALDAATPGDDVEVASGVYFEKVALTHGGNAIDGYVTLRPAAGAPTPPVIDGTGISGGDIVLIDSKSYVRVEGFEIVHNLGVTDGSGVRVLGSGTHIEILDNTIHEIRGQNAMGITIYATEPAPIQNLVIEGNEVFDCDPATSEAITLNGNVDGFEVTHNIVRDVNNIGIDFIGGETDIQPNPAP